MILKIVGICLLIILCQSGKVPIQAHSFNDLDYITNLLAKGIDYYKIDVSMANRKSCQQFSTWNKTKKCLKTSEYVQQICCLALRGDASSRPSFTYNFNTSQQYARFLDQNLAKIIAFQPKRKILFAINFQYSHSFEDFITQQFLSSLADILNKYPHNILLGTGTDSFILEYDRICYGKGTSQCNDLRRKISKSNMFLQSGAMNPFDSRDFYKRFRNFNVFYKQIDHYCQNGFPTWINNYPQFPLIFWEPSNQNQIKRVISQFLSPNCMKKHGRNLTGMAVATNIDVEMFDIYMKYTIEPVATQRNLHTMDSIDNAGIAWVPSVQKLLLNQQVNVRLTKIKVGKNQIVYSASSTLFENQLVLQKWQYDLKSSSMKVTASRKFSTSFLQSNQVIQDLLADNNNHLILVTSGKTQNFNTVYYFNTDSNFQLINSKSWTKIYAMTMKDNQLLYVTCDTDLTTCNIKGSIQFRQTAIYATFSAKSFLSKITSMEIYDRDFLVVGEGAETKDLSYALWIKQGQMFPPPFPLSLGQNPKIFRKQSGKQFGVILQNSMCASALLINNGNLNKCNFFKQPELASLRNVRGLVNLLQFNIADLIGNSQIISPCNSRMSLTKIMNGGNTDIIELRSLGTYLIASQYLRIEKQDLMAALFCGGSNFDKAFKYRQSSSLLTTMILSNRNTNSSISDAIVYQKI